MQSRSKQRDVTVANVVRAVGASQRHQNRRGDFFDSACLNGSKTQIMFFLSDFFVPEVM